MAFTGHEDQYISLDDAAQMCKNYRESQSDPMTVLAHYFSKDTISGILNQTDCVGIRVYYALDTNGKKQLVIVGVNASENDLYQGLIADRSIQCPPVCGASNPLNS